MSERSPHDRRPHRRHARPAPEAHVRRAARGGVRRWTSPEVLRRWWAAGPDWTTPEAQVDLRAGGRYRLSMGNPQTGDVHTINGEYTEVDRARRLAYTWQWEGDSADGASAGSLVEVEFVAEGDGTTVLLAHTGIRTADSRSRHEHGWVACLDNLRDRVLRG